jgi:hypothetical protein
MSFWNWRLLKPATAAVVALCGGAMLAQEPAPPSVPSVPPAAPAPVAPPPAPPTAPLAQEDAPPLLTVPAMPSKPLLSPLATKPDWSTLKAVANTMTRTEFQHATASVYLDDSAQLPPWRIEGDSLIVETSPGDLPLTIAFVREDALKNKPLRYWRTVQELPPLQRGDPPLKGLHIALDPGHIGGGYAQVEERWLSMNPGEAIMEGSLVLQVANLLKPRLEALGAVVTFVRDQEAPVTTDTPDSLRPVAKQVLLEAGITDPPDSYTNRYDERRIISVQWQAEKLFYRVSEIRARARRVNQELKPDLVLCLHLNAEAWGDPEKPAFVPQNHLHLLVNGCYSPAELRHEDIRHEMLQRLFSRVHEHEIPLADTVAGAMAQATALPAYVYTKNTARRVSGSPYVYARNLLANRTYQCPVLYFEPYVMNHEETYKRLLLGHYIGRTLMDGRLVSSPLEDYTRGVVRGLEEYYSANRKKETP